LNKHGVITAADGTVQDGSEKNTIQNKRIYCFHSNFSVPPCTVLLKQWILLF